MRKKLISAILMLMVTCLLAGCKGSHYKDAVALQDVADYEGALAIYETLGDYKDAQERADECEQYISAIREFEQAKEQLEKLNMKLDSQIDNAYALVQDEAMALDEMFRTALETAISEAKAEKVEVEVFPVELEEINKKTEQYRSVDYSVVLEKLDMAYANLDKSIRQFALVNVPAESYIIQCLGKVENVIDISAVTEDNDPNGNLNKAGGYTAQVFFSSDLIIQGSVYGTTVIDKGTDCGGSIEVYETVEDAKKREEYLAGFDGGLFASGSHEVVGTCLIRTSNELTASQQKKMEADIIEILTYIGE